MSDTTLINDVSINGNELTPDELSETLQDNTINALGVDASSRTIWVNGQPYGNAYVNIKDENILEAPIGAEIFNDFEHNVAAGEYSHAEGYNTSAMGDYSHASGLNTIAYGNSSFIEGRSTGNATNFDLTNYNVLDDWKNASVEDKISIAIGIASHVEGRNNLAIGIDSHAEGTANLAQGNRSHAEGYENISEGNNSHAEGANTSAKGYASHAEGYKSAVDTSCSAGHVEGFNTIAGGTYESNVLTHGTTQGAYIHAEGNATLAIGRSAHSEGERTFAKGNVSHSEGYFTQALNPREHAEGSYNKSTVESTAWGKANTIHSVGIGSTEATRKNAHEIMQDGKHYIYKVGGYDGTNPSSSKDLATILSTVDSSDTNSFVVENDLVVSGNTTLGDASSDSITVNGTTKLNGTLEVSGNTTFETVPSVNDAKIVLEIEHITYLDLKALKEASNLVPGQQYRIIDYVTTTSQTDTDSVGHPFDIIVTADNESKLNEVARAIQHSGENDHFANLKLSAWKIWYCFDNDKDRFDWAVPSEDGGKGVIYRMIDEWNNDLPYDFKNIRFRRYKLNAPEADYTLSNTEVVKWVEQISENITVMFDSYNENSYVWSGITTSDKYWTNNGDGTYVRSSYAGESKLFYTFHSTDDDTDASLLGGCHDNKMMASNTLPNNVFFGSFCYCNSFGNNCGCNTFSNSCGGNTFGNNCSFNTFGSGCSNNIFGGECKSNTFGNNCSFNTFGNFCSKNSFLISCDHNSFGEECFSNSFRIECAYNSFDNSYSYNTFRDRCNSNSFGDDCTHNSFGNDCTHNSFGNDCKSNTFDFGCNYNIFGNYCVSNSFGGQCTSNSFGNSYSYNIFGDSCDYNSFGNSCSFNTFGDECISNSFGNDCSGNEFGSTCIYNSFGNDCQYNSFRLNNSKDADLVNNCHYNHFDDGCSYIILYTLSSSHDQTLKVKNYNIKRGITGDYPDYIYILLIPEQIYEIQVAKTPEGEINQYYFNSTGVTVIK